MSLETEVMFGNADSECAKLGRATMEFGEFAIGCALERVLDEVVVVVDIQDEEEDDLLQDMKEVRVFQSRRDRSQL